MASLADIAAGIAEKFSDVAGLRFDAFVPDQINPPAGFVYCTSWNDETLDGNVMCVFNAVILVARGASARVGQASLLDLVTPGGVVVAAINDNDDLGLSDGTQASITGYQSLRIEEIAAYPYYGGAFEIQVTTPS